MTTKPPPIPPANQSPHGSAQPADKQADMVERGNRPAPGNLAEQDRQGNIKQNTTHQGHQQDR